VSEAAELRRVQDATIEGKTVLVRVDYNVPIQDGEIADDSRISASLATLRFLLDGGAKVVVVTHLGRPDGTVVPELRLDPIAQRLADLIDLPVRKADETVGEGVAAAIEQGRPGDLFLLENVRFRAEEEANDPGFSRALADLAELYVNDAFATVHRAHASTMGVTEFLPSYAGLLMQQEVDALSALLDAPDRPYVAIVGGKKAQSKLGALADLVSRVDTILVGGGVAFTFLAADGAEVGASIVDEDVFGEIARIRSEAEKAGVEILLPSDVVLAQRLDAETETEIGDARAIPEGWAGFDIGPETVRRFGEAIAAAKTVVWTGPMGAFEFGPFSHGTCGVAEALAASDAYSVIGGGETADAVARAGFGGGVSYISTGGGACLALLRGRTLPALEALRG